MCPIFVGSVYNFGRSDSHIICLFTLDASYVVSFPTQTENLRQYLGIRDRVQIKMCSIAVGINFLPRVTLM